MIVSTHGILASSGGVVDNASGYLFKSTTDSTVVTGVIITTISYSNLIPANTMLVGDFFQYNFIAIKVGTAGSCIIRVYFNTSASLIGATAVGVYTMTATTLNATYTKIALIKSATNTDVQAAVGSILTRDAIANSIATSSININWTVDQYFIIAFTPTSALDSTYANGLFFLKT